MAQTILVMTTVGGIDKKGVKLAIFKAVTVLSWNGKWKGFSSS